MIKMNARVFDYIIKLHEVFYDSFQIYRFIQKCLLLEILDSRISINFP